MIIPKINKPITIQIPPSPYFNINIQISSLSVIPESDPIAEDRKL